MHKVQRQIANDWEEARKLGYDVYKETLIAEGRYQEQSRCHHRGKGRYGRRGDRLACEQILAR